MFKWIAIPLGYLMNWCYLLADSVLKLPLAYVFAMFFFAIITKLLQFPLAINQQKSSAKMAAIQPLMLDIQKKFAKDKQRQQVETQKLQEEMGYNPMSGCLPMIIQFVLMFGFVEVIYAPLTYMIRVSAEAISKFGEVVTKVTGIASTDRLFETKIIEYVQTQPNLFSQSGFSDSIAQISDLGMSIGDLHLWEKPVISEPSLLWLMPLFSIVAMLLSTFVMNKTNPTTANAGGTGKMMTYAMVGVSAIFSFMWPAAFSLYWGFQSLISIVQTLILRKIINSDKIKEETLKAYEERKKAVKGTKKVQVTDKRTGKVVEKEISGSDLAKQRLQKARELDAEKYSDDEIADIPYVEYEGKKIGQKDEPAKKNKKSSKSEEAEKEESRKAFDDMFNNKEKGKKKKKK